MPSTPKHKTSRREWNTQNRVRVITLLDTGSRRFLVEVKERLGLPLHDRPVPSPDLNPIENVWKTMKQCIKQRIRFLSTVPEMHTVPSVKEEASCVTALRFSSQNKKNALLVHTKKSVTVKKCFFLNARYSIAVQEEWDRLQPADWNKYIDNMPERIREVKARRGMQAPY
jgi:hypothetical protein